MKTIAQQLNIKEFPFEIRDKNGNEIYYEDSDGFWVKWEYDSRGNEIYCEDSDGLWVKREFDSRGNEIYCEDSDGRIIDRRTKEVTLEEVADKFGIDVRNLKIKK
jgi:hypothetical protein